MNNELVLSIEVEDNGSLKVNNFGRAIEDTGKRTEEMTGRFNNLNTVLGRVGEGLFSQKKVVSGLADAFGSLASLLSGIQDTAGRSLQRIASSSGPAFGNASLFGPDSFSYSAPGSGSTTSASMGLGSLGLESLSSLTGSLGVVVDGFMVALLTKVKESGPQLPSFNLLWETIDGQIEGVTETWRNMGRNQKVVAAAEEVLQSQLDFFNKLAMVAGGQEIPSFDFSLGGVGKSIDDILKQQTTQGLIKTAIGGAGQLSEVFGPGFQGQLKDIFMETLTHMLGMFTFDQDQEIFQQYMNWKFNQLSSLPPEQSMADFDAWMQAPSIFSPVGRPGIHMSSIFDLFMSKNPGLEASDFNEDTFKQLEQFAEGATPGWFTRGEIALSAEKSQEAWKEFFTDLNQQVTDIFDLVTVGMGDAFVASLKTGEFETFEQTFKQSILNGIQQSLIKGFAEQELLPIIFRPFYGAEDRPALTEVLKQYANGDLSLGQTQGYLTQMASELTDTLDGFEPVWETLNTAFGSLSEALGLNTAGVEQNTDAILGPVNNFLTSLETGSLAPAMSLAGLEGLKEELYTGALADPKEFAAYANFMTSQYLPWRQEVSADYANEITGVQAEVENIPWVQDARGVTSVGGRLPAETSAQDIGREVSQALAPMLLDLKESGWQSASDQITINVVVDGQIIKQAVIDSFDDPSVVQKARARI